MADFDASTATATAAASALAADRVLVYSPGNGTWEVLRLDILLQALGLVATAAGPVVANGSTVVLVTSGGNITFGSAGVSQVTGVHTLTLSSSKCQLQNSQGIRCASDYPLVWVASGGADSGTLDTGLIRVAPGVVAPTPGTTTPGAGCFLQNTGGRARNTANVTNATATFAGVADLSVTVAAGRKYTGRLVVRCSDSTAAEGIKFDFNGGTATMTTFNAVVMDNPQAATAGTILSTSLAGALNFTSMSGTGDNWFVIEFSFVVNAAGTFIPRFAQNSHSTGTATLALGSSLWVEDMPA